MMRQSIAVLLAIISSVVAAESGESCPKDDAYFVKGYLQADNPEAFNLRWARCAQKRGEEEKAVAAYERVLMINPENLEAAKALAKYYNEKGLSYEVWRLSETLSKSRFTPKQKRIVDTLLFKERELVSTHLSARLDIGYDNNVNFGIPHGPIQTVGKKEGTLFHALSLKGNYMNDMASKGGYFWQANAEVYWQNDYHAHRYDTLLGSFDVGAGYRTQNTFFYFPLLYKRLYYLENDLYEQYGVAPEATLSFSRNWMLHIRGVYLKRNYLDAFYKNADDTMLQIGVGAYRFYGENYLYASLKYSDFNAEKRNSLPFTEYDNAEITIGGSYMVESVGIVDAHYSYAHADYSDEIVGSGQKRNDDSNTVIVSLRRPLSASLNLIVSASYAHNDSNFDAASYEKGIFTVGVEYDY